MMIPGSRRRDSVFHGEILLKRDFEVSVILNKQNKG